MTPQDDHDMIIEMHGWMKNMARQCDICSKTLKEHGDEIADVQGDIKAIKQSQAGLFAACGIAITSAVGAIVAWLTQRG